MPTLLSTLRAAVSNKNVKKYACLFTASRDNITHIDKASKRKSKLTTTQIKTKRRNNSFTNNNGRFIKDLS